MARLAVSLAVIFSLLVLSHLVLSHARVPLNLPANNVSELKPLYLSSESDATEPDLQPNNNIRLPSERSEFQTVSTHDLPVSDTKTISAIGTTRPLSLSYDIRFRPINRHFHHMHLVRPLRFRYPCRHHGGKPMMGGPWLNKREISYGNDMLMSKNPSELKFRDVVGGIPVKPFRGFAGERMRSFAALDLDVKPVVGEMESEKAMKVEGEEEESGFLKQFRKFLNRL